MADYAEEREGKIVFRGHGVYAWDTVNETYCMYWFDTMLPCPTLVPARGTWHGDTLTFDIAGDGTDYRYVYDFLTPGYYEFRIEYRAHAGANDLLRGHLWATAVRGKYVRQ